MNPKRTCNECNGNGGWYTAPNGDEYLSDPDGSMEKTWRRCPRCRGVGQIGGEDLSTINEQLKRIQESAKNTVYEEEE